MISGNDQKTRLFRESPGRYCLLEAYWKCSNPEKIQALLLSILDTPFQGIGKPEALKYDLSGSWSRRINHEHRIVYQVEEDIIKIESLKGHY